MATPPPDPNSNLTFAQFQTFTTQMRAELKVERDSEHLQAASTLTDRQKRRDEQQESDRAERKAENLAKAIPHCDGLNQDNLRDWLREIDMTVENSKLTLYIASLASRGSLRREIVHFLSLHPDRTQATWVKAKAHIQKVFLSPREQDRLRAELQTIRQGGFETTPAYCMRFRELAEVAYKKSTHLNGQTLPRSKEVEELILDAFIGGLSDQDMADKLLNFGMPSNYTDAIERVSEYDANNTKLSLTRQRFQGLRQEEPMDISAVTKGPSASDDLAEVKRQVSGLANQFTKLMATLKSGHSAPVHQAPAQRAPAQHSARQPRQGDPEYTFTPEGRPICNYCNKVGHIAKVCRKRQTDRQGRGHSTYNNPTSNQGGR